MSYVRAPREGRIVTASTLERSTLEILRRLLPAYGQAVAEQEGVPVPAPPRSYTCAGGLDKWVDDQLPAVVVVSPGTTSRPEMRGGSYSAVFGLVVGVYCSAATQGSTHDLIRLWVAAARACLVQHPSLGGLCSDLVLVNERYDERPVQDRRTLAVGSVAWEVRLNDVVSANAGPLVGTEPPDDLPWSEVATTEVEVERLPDPASEEAA